MLGRRQIQRDVTAGGIYDKWSCLSRAHDRARGGQSEGNIGESGSGSNSEEGSVKVAHGRGWRLLRKEGPEGQ
jgi:hypothetical protein